MTILGAHTAHELSDWLDALDQNIAGIVAAAAATPASPEHTAWDASWATFMAGWTPLETTARAAIASDQAGLLGWDANTEEGLWDQVTAYLANSDGSSKIDSFFQSQAKLPNAVADAQTSTVQPTAPDADTSFFTSTTGLANAVDSAVAGVENAAKSLTSAFASPWLWIGAGVVGALALVVVAKKAL